MTRAARLMLLAAVISALVTPGVGTTAAAIDPFTGVWVGTDPDGSLFRITLGAPGPNGARAFTAFDSYATYCEQSGPGSGSTLTAQGTATTAGTSLTVTFTSVHCANGSSGAFPPPFTLTGTLLPDGTLDFQDILTRPGGA